MRPWVIATFALLLAAVLAAGVVYLYRIAPVINEARRTIAEAHTLIAEVRSALEQANRAVGTVAPVIDKAHETIKRAEDATNKANAAIENAPTETLKRIPFLNWFVR